MTHLAFCANYYRFRAAIISNFDHENVDYGHGVHLSQYRAMTNIEIYKSRISHFCSRAHRFRDINISELYL